MVLIAVSLVIAAAVGAVYGAPHLKPSPRLVAIPTPTPVETAQGQVVTYTFLSASLGWAAVQSQGAASVWIFRTTDAAKTWLQTAVVTGPSGAGVETLHFFDRSRGYLVAGGFVAVTAVSAKPDFHVFSTRDGGASWTAAQSPDPMTTSFSFTDPLHGWATATTDDGTRLFATRDGGESWSRLPDLPDGQIPLFRSPTEAWLSADSPAGPHEVFSSTDGGVTWTPHVVASPLAGMARGSIPRAAAGYVGFSAVILLPGSGVLVNVEQPCAGKAQCSQTGPAAYTSFDGGTTWQTVTTPPGGDFTPIAFQDGHHWWLIESNSLWKTADAGQSWKLVSDRVFYEQLTPTIIDGAHAWVQVPLTDDTRPGRPLSVWELDMTGDGGASWNQVGVPVAR